MEVIIISLIFVALIILYILNGLSLYTISRRRGLPHPWMSWVPLMRVFQLGTVADHYRLAGKGKKGLMRWALILFGAINAAGVSWALYILLKILGSSILVMFTLGLVLLSEEYTDKMAELNKWLDIATGCGIATFIPIIVVHIIARYRVYRSCSPSTAVLCLLANLFVPFLHPLFLFLMRKKDDAAVYPPAPSPVEIPEEYAACPEAEAASHLGYANTEIEEP